MDKISCLHTNQGELMKRNLKIYDDLIEIMGWTEKQVEYFKKKQLSNLTKKLIHSNEFSDFIGNSILDCNDLNYNFGADKKFLLNQFKKMTNSEGYSYAEDSLAINFADEKIQHDEEFMMYFLNKFPQIYKSVRCIEKYFKNEELIKKVLHAGYVDVVTGSYLRDDRIGVVYRLSKINANYEKLAGNRLKKKLNGVGVVDYVEKQNLIKTLNKDLSKSKVVTKCNKI